eukprot:CAMPEP_0195506858 /NCGR_PEP_ID=MMETSP0794_2-20130614/401_1 /TAXON_ID=515487 /ORGANISM="Stephanopyxis turris, Strain CCMP 815" /LENGTH=1043 /DNA_ID=CAMNT_0040633319 /DNA_START=15 /DNA_END=3146 /DNA_ORIENTATION=-
MAKTVMRWRVLALSSLVVLAGQHASAFTPFTLQNQRARPSFFSSSTETAESVDISIDYDAAARVAYDSWRARYNKGDFDPDKYNAFKVNYEAISVYNVIAAKEAREASLAAGNGQAITSKPKMALNECADLTQEEYEAMNSKGASSAPETIMSQVAEGAVVQDQASNALDEASDALAEEEEKLAKKLGLESVEELETALDAMAGVAPDGGELDPENLSREARVREAYLGWCKEQSKEPDEERFPVFSSNFLLMEEYAKENGKEMSLNAYADCTEEEYLAATTAKAEEKVEETIVEKVVETEEESEPETVDISIVYDSAARVAYDAWRTQYNKGDFDDKKFDVFKANYETVAVANVVAAKEAREASIAAGEGQAITSTPKMELDDSADTVVVKPVAEVKEPAAAVKKPPAFTNPFAAPMKMVSSTRKVETKEARAQRMADAKAKAEEAKNARAQAKVDAEAAYVAKKKQIEDEKAATAKAAAEAQAAVEKEKKARQAAQDKAAEKLRLDNEKIAIAAAKAEAEASAAQVAKRRAFDEAAAEIDRKKAKLQAERLAKAFPDEPVREVAKPKPKVKKVVPPAKKLTPPPPPVESKAAAPIEEKEAPKPGGGIFGSFFSPPAKKTPVKDEVGEKAAAEAAAAAKVKKEAEEKAAAAAKAKKEAEVKAAAEKKAAAAAAKAKAEAEAKAKLTAAKKKSSVSAAKAATPKSPTLDTSDPVSDAFASFFGAKKSQPKKEEPAPTPEPAPAPVAKKPEPFSFFPKPAPKKVAPAPEPVPARKPVAKKPEPFSFFEKPAPKKAEPVPVPAPAPVAKKPEPFSFFGKPAPKKAPPAPIPAPAPVAKKPEPFSFFGKPAPKKAPPAPVPAPVAKKPEPFSFFGQPAPKKAPPAPVPAPTPVAKKPEPFSLFGKPAPKKAEAVPEPTPAPKKAAAFSFGKPAAKKAVAPKVEPAEKAPEKNGGWLGLGTFAIKQPKPPANVPVKKVAGRAAKPAAKDNIPVLTDFVQNADGSLTGDVSNSKDFRDGTPITTSPVRRGAKAGMLVKTSSGSMYRLK